MAFQNSPQFNVDAAAAPHAISLPPGAVEFAREIVHDTGQFLKATHGRLDATLKYDGSLVTASDVASDQRLTAAIHARFPDHGVLSEEQDTVFHGEEWCWVIDPIDGTTNFKWGFPIWGVLMGLLHHGQPVLGVAEFPMTDEQYWAALGQGAWRNGERIMAAAEQPPNPTQLVVACTRSLKTGPLGILPKTRVSGSAGYDLAALACGIFVGALELTVHVWDVAALWPIVSEAGGLVESNSADPLFPLRAGEDHLKTIFSILGASSPEMQRYLRDGLSDRFIRREP